MHDAVDLFTGISDAEASVTVIFTPEWNVHEVLAHMVVGLTRRAEGIDEPMPDAESSDAARRAAASASVESLLRRAVDAANAVDWPGPTGGPRLAWDLAVHLTDVRETLGRPGLAPELWQPVLDEALTFLTARGLVAPSTRLPTDRHALFRVVFGRLDPSSLPVAGGSGWPSEARFFA